MTEMNTNEPQQSTTTNEEVTVEFNSIICDAAREYLEMGFSVIPLSLGTKKALNSWKKYQTEKITEEDIDQWEEHGAPTTEGETIKNFNLAIITGAISGIVVVDCDNEEAVAFAKSKGMTSPIAVKTRRGMHFYFRHPNNGRRFRNKTGNNPGRGWYDCDGLDFRGDGGLVVAPPSVSLNPDGSIKHRYHWSFAEGLNFDDMPVWKGEADDMDNTESFDFATLSLANVEIGETVCDVREQIKKRVDYLGRKLRGPDMGDATDSWMIKFCGQMVRRGMVNNELATAVSDFFNEFFEWHGNARDLTDWLSTKMRSAMDMDKRNHPDDYDKTTGERLIKDIKSAELETNTNEVKTFTPIYGRDLKRIMDTLGDQEFLLDPIFPKRSIIQVAGYNGHGKSLVVGAAITAMAANCTNFGPFTIPDKVKAFYMDFDNPARTVMRRFSTFTNMFGDTGDNLALWSPAIIPPEHGGQMNLRDEAGLEIFENWLNTVKPDIVVIDTIRNAFGGFDEKDPREWFHVNRVAKVIRDRYKATVVLVHHRNKPNEQGLGREAGSTAQLTDIDTQLFVTQVFNDKLIAKSKAGLFNDDLKIERHQTAYTPFGYFEEKITKANLQNDHRLRTVTEISFGKVREETDMHKTCYLGWVENIHTGEQRLLHNTSIREDALAMFAKGIKAQQIAQKLFIPAETIEGWVMRHR